MKKEDRRDSDCFRRHLVAESDSGRPTADGRHGNDAGQLLAGIADRSGPGAAERRQKNKENTHR